MIATLGTSKASAVIPATNQSVIASYKRARLKVQEQWLYSPDLMCEGAGVHGHVQKTAVGSELAIVMNTDWIKSFVAAKVPIYAGIQVRTDGHARHSNGRIAY